MNPKLYVEGALVRIKHDGHDDLGGQIAKIVHVGLITTCPVVNSMDCFELLLQDGSVQAFHCLEFVPLTALEQLARVVDE